MIFFFGFSSRNFEFITIFFFFFSFRFFFSISSFSIRLFCCLFSMTAIIISIFIRIRRIDAARRSKYRSGGKRKIEYVEQFELLLTTLFVIILVFFFLYFCKLFYLLSLHAYLPRCAMIAPRYTRGNYPREFFLFWYLPCCDPPCAVCVCVCVHVCVCVFELVTDLCVCVCVWSVYLLLLLLYLSCRPHPFCFSSCLFICISNVAFLHRATPKVLSTPQTTHLPHTHTHTHTQQWVEAKSQQPLKMITQIHTKAPFKAETNWACLICSYPRSWK